MHELSIAFNIVEIVTEKAAENRVSKVNEVELDIGEASGVIPEALEFALEAAVKDTILEKTKFILHHIKPEAICNECKTVFEPPDIFSPCPECGSFRVSLVKGNEMKVKSMQIE